MINQRHLHLREACHPRYLVVREACEYTAQVSRAPLAPETLAHLAVLRNAMHEDRQREARVERQRLFWALALFGMALAVRMLA